MITMIYNQSWLQFTINYKSIYNQLQYDLQGTTINYKCLQWFTINYKMIYNGLQWFIFINYNGFYN